MQEKNNKNICFFSGDITNSGGTERVATIIASELAKEKSKYNIYFVSLFEKRKESFFYLDSSIKRYKLYDTPIRGITHIVQICYKLAKIIKENNIDVIIDIDGILDIYSLIVKMFTGVKVISWEHFNYYQHPTVGHRKYTRALSGRFANAIVTLTKEDTEYYKENLKIKCLIQHIHNPVMNLQKQQEYDINSKTILSVGRLTHQKGFDMLVDVANIVLNKHSNWKWIILGDGEDKGMLEDKIKGFNLEDRVILEGNVYNIDDYYSKTGIFVLTSRYEGLPMTLLETKPFKLPVVSFDIKTGVRECIKDGINGYLVDEFDIEDMAKKIEKLINNKDLRSDFSEAAMKDTEKFDIRGIINQWNELIHMI